MAEQRQEAPRREEGAQRYAVPGTIPTLGDGWLPVSPTHTALSAHLVPASRVRHLVPAGLAVVQVLPGLTLASTLLSFYGPGSTLEYSELVVAPALVRCGAARGFWVSHIWVDNADSVTGGRRMGLPKQLARFEWRASGREGGCTLSDPGGRPLARVRWWSRPLALRGSLAASTLSALDDGRVVRFRSALRARWALACVEVDFPVASGDDRDAARAFAAGAAPPALGRAAAAVVSGPMTGEMGIDLREVGRIAPRAEPLLR
ncbi:MAG: acetoacetate decarboxylase family protein [Gemmatimonadetes bacterium]|nr:acetoacetate decarboxylase family protein [Gemmatimonadota bacterium]